MWAKGRFSRMAEFVNRARELGFQHIEPNAFVTPAMLRELLKTGVPISSIHSPCPAVLSRGGVPVSKLSLSSLDDVERTKAIRFIKKTIDLAAIVGARAIVLHMGEVPVDLNLQDRLYKLHDEACGQTRENQQARERLVGQRTSLAHPYVDAARKSLQQLASYSQEKGIMLGLETRFYFNEIPSIDEMSELLDVASRDVVGYWHDVGHAEVQQRLGFSCHEEWLSRFSARMVGVHLHDIRDLSDHQAPGTGNMRWEMIAKHLSQEVIRVCEIGEWNDEEQMRGVIGLLRRKGVLG